MNTSKNIIADNTVHAQVELICLQGCEIVRQYIKALQADTESQANPSNQVSASLPDIALKRLSETTVTQKQEILKELKTIMAVYDNKNCNGS